MNKMFPISALLIAGLASASQTAPRPPAVAGHFYPAKAKALAAFVEEALAAAPEPFPAGADVVALLVPHAGLEFSGRTAARAYKALKKGAFDAVIVVGTSHYKALEGAALYPGDYATPEGAMPYAAGLGRALLRASKLIKSDAAAHKKEHSIEVQLPFLRRALGPVPLAALIMNTQDLDAAREIGAAIAAAAKGKRVLLVASSDMSHYPSGGVAEAVDRTTLCALETLDAAYFWLTNRLLMNRALPNLAVTWCGEGAVTAVMTAARQLGANRFSVLAHINSGDVVSERDYTHVVGYSAAAFVREAGAVPGRRALTSAQKGGLLKAAKQAMMEAAAGRSASAPLSAEAAFNLPAAVFVTLREKGGALRGCMGSTSPQESLLEAAVRWGAGAAASDKRFKPVSPDEAPSLKIEVSVLSGLTPASAEKIQPGDGVVLEMDGRQAVLLPEVWKTLPRKDQFLSTLCEEKAGLSHDCWKNPAVELRTFTVDSFGE